jgi:hypothetical protein
VSENALLAGLWALTLTVLVLGAVAGSVIALVWGVVGLLGALGLTVWWVRQRRREAR